MPTSVRLDRMTEALAERLAARRGQTKSELIREAIRRLAADHDEGRTSPYEAMRHLIGSVRSGGKEHSSERTGAGFAAIVQQKHHARRSR